MQIKNFAKILLNCSSHADSVAISGHKSPDYDCLCSSIAMQEILKQNGINADILLEKPLDETFDELVRDIPYITETDKVYEVVISVDVPEKNMLPAIAQAKREGALHTFCIDHHQEKEKYMDYMQVLNGESSACEVIFRTFEPYFKLNKKLASIFYLGIYADTGGFIYSNTHSSTFTVLSKLLTQDITADELVSRAFQSVSPNSFEMTKRAMNSVKFYHNGEIAVSVLRQNDFKETNAPYGDSKAIVGYLQRIKGVKVAISIFEPDNKGDFHVSLRTGCPNVDVSKIANKFNGGGHVRASGLKLVGDYDKALNALLNQTKSVLEDKND